MGADVLSLLSVPVFIMEPTSMLQKMGEIMEYAALLDAADGAGDPFERCACLVGGLGCGVGVWVWCGQHAGAFAVGGTWLW